MDELPFDLEPFTKRNTPTDSKVYTEFTMECRKRLYAIFSKEVNGVEISEAYHELNQEYVREFEGFADSSWDLSQQLKKFVYDEDHEFVLEYVEYLYNIMWASNRSHDILLKYDSRLRRLFRETRILVRLTPNHDRLTETFRRGSSSKRYRPGHQGPITFEIVGSEALLDADADVQKITERTAWQQAVEPYNEAWERYQSGSIDLVLFKRLNKSIENVVYKICKDENSWVDDGAGLGPCLNELQERGFFQPNNEVYGEWEKIAAGLRIGIRKPSKDKHRHEEIREDYAIMMLHQVAAFLTFLIQRYHAENQ